ncbi:MAG: cold shock domain-containing protein [Pricia sp.]
MAKSQQTYSKTEKEKKRLKKREEKQKKKEARKAGKDSGEGIPFAYVDHNGNLVDTPPDPSEKVKVDAEDIVLGIPPKEEGDEDKFDPVRTGRVSFFDFDKGFGFIVDSENSQEHFVHVSGLIDEINEGNQVSFELEQGRKGLNAVRVKRV